MSSLLIWIPLLVGVWVAQSFLVFLQARAVTRRISALRQGARVAVGLGRSRIRVRTFVLVSADRADRVVKVESLSGWSVFARPQDMARYAGLPLAELPDIVRAQKAPRPFQVAVEQAVKALLEPEPSTEGAVMPDRHGPDPEEEEGGVPIDRPV
jgi:DNA-binding transcriptional regulator of glucitol operon